MLCKNMLTVAIGVTALAAMFLVGSADTVDAAASPAFRTKTSHARRFRANTELRAHHDRYLAALVERADELATKKGKRRGRWGGRGRRGR